MSELLKIAGALALLVGLAGVSGGVGARSVTTAPEGAVVTSARAKAPVHSATVSIDGVSDGDTFYVRLDGSSVRVRLAGVDAPEKRQPFVIKGISLIGLPEEIIGHAKIIIGFIHRHIAVTWLTFLTHGFPR